MIARHWSARATVDGAEAYVRFFAERLVPELREIDGHRGAEVFTRPGADGVEITVLTFWDSMAAVRRFAGAAPERAVVEPEARAVLRDFDTEVRHLTLRVDTWHVAGRHLARSGIDTWHVAGSTPGTPEVRS